MKFNIINDLVRSPEKKRGKLLLQMRERNIAYFKRKYPDLPIGGIIEQMGTGRFEIQVNDDFLNIYDTQAQSYCHPPNRLLDYIKTLGSWHHDGWLDKLEPVHTIYPKIEHWRLVLEFLEKTYSGLTTAHIQERMATGEIQLPRLPDGRRYSGPVVFLGIFSGLHIAHYLHTTEVRDVVLIEPDLEKFVLSCFFLDYQAIDQRFGRVVLHLGEDLPESPLDFLVQESTISASAWLRILPAYPDLHFDALIHRVNLRWRAFHEITVPFDREVRNLTYGATNLRAGRPILHRQPKLSSASRIAVVASGPSLNNDLAWLKKNQTRLIIFAVHSAVRVLRQNGIKPDFQCTLDTELTPETLEKLQLDPEIPLIIYYKADPIIFEKFRTVLMVQEQQKSNVVQFTRHFSFTHPTSGNLTTVAAQFMRPAELYLLGLDFGSREGRLSHAKGSWHDDNDGAGHKQEAQNEQIPCLANFPDRPGQMFTQSYYHQARMEVEQLLLATADTNTVYNLSDGARIEGAVAKATADIDLPVYRQKKKDIEHIIHEAFTSNYTEVLYLYDSKGQDMLRQFADDLFEQLTLKRFDWASFSRALDKARGIAGGKWYAAHGGDLRLEAYYGLINDLLLDWYRIMIFCRTAKEAEQAYRAGLSALKMVFDELKWPEMLDIRAEELPNYNHAAHTA